MGLGWFGLVGSRFFSVFGAWVKLGLLCPEYYICMGNILGKVESIELIRWDMHIGLLWRCLV